MFRGFVCLFFFRFKNKPFGTAYRLQPNFHNFIIILILKEKVVFLLWIFRYFEHSGTFTRYKNRLLLVQWIASPISETAIGVTKHCIERLSIPKAPKNSTIQTSEKKPNYPCEKKPNYPCKIPIFDAPKPGSFQRCEVQTPKETTGNAFINSYFTSWMFSTMQTSFLAFGASYWKPIFLYWTKWKMLQWLKLRHILQVEQFCSIEKKTIYLVGEFQRRVE